uniref:Uncharacterized protein n=1 Tax=Arundo donax TaxID=35708 RepID=A0A0A9DCP9_ARUDO
MSSSLPSPRSAPSKSSLISSSNTTFLSKRIPFATLAASSNRPAPTNAFSSAS